MNMRLLKILTFSLILNGCAPEPNFFVGPTPIYLEDGAKEQVPCDFVAVLRETYREIESRFSTETANTIMKIPIRLYPDYATPVSKLNYSLYLNGLKEGGEIHVRILSSTILISALLHEQIDHCLCAIEFDDINYNHKNTECEIQEFEFYNIILERTRAERENRCLDEYWR